jgi:hypothetical protein
MLPRMSAVLVMVGFVMVGLVTVGLVSRGCVRWAAGRVAIRLGVSPSCASRSVASRVPVRAIRVFGTPVIAGRPSANPARGPVLLATDSRARAVRVSVAPWRVSRAIVALSRAFRWTVVPSTVSRMTVVRVSEVLWRASRIPGVR